MAHPSAFDPTSILEKLRASRGNRVPEHAGHAMGASSHDLHGHGDTNGATESQSASPLPSRLQAPVREAPQRRIQELEQALQNSQNQVMHLRSEYHRLQVEFSTLAQADQQEVQRLRSVVVELEASLNAAKTQPVESFPEGILFRSEQPGAEDAPPVLEWRDMSETPPPPPREPLMPSSGANHHHKAAERRERQGGGGTRGPHTTTAVSIDIRTRGGNSRRNVSHRESSTGKPSRLYEPTFSAEQRIRTKSEMSPRADLEEFLRKPSKKEAAELSSGKPAFASGAAPPGATSHRFGAGARKLKAPVRIPEAAMAMGPPESGATGSDPAATQPAIIVDFSKELL